MLQDSKQARRDVRRVARKWGRPTWRRVQRWAQVDGTSVVRRRLGRYIVEVVAVPVPGHGVTYLQFHARIIGNTRDTGYGNDLYDLLELRDLFADVAQRADHADMIGGAS